MMHRKLRKFIKSPGLFLRDSFIKKYPLSLNQNNVKYNTESILFNNEKEILSGFDPEFKIDIVYSWVDSKKSNWMRKKTNYESLVLNSEQYAKDSARFESHNEIYYSLISVEKYLPWVNKIYIITDGQSPIIPSCVTNKIEIIDHSIIIPTEYLPTFNSHVIEAYLHNIPHLTENFIYFNDDFFVARPLSPSHFFRSNGLCSLFKSSKNINEMNLKGKITATLTATNNCNRILKERFNRQFENSLTHTYVPLKKSMYIKAFGMFHKEIEEFSKNKFRGASDLNMATFLIPYMQYIDGLSTPHLDICYYFNIRSPSANSFYKNLLSKRQTPDCPHSFCANDFNSCDFESNNSFSINLNEFLINYYGNNESKTHITNVSSICF